MPCEIERKFLVIGDGWRDGSPGTRIAQGYLSMDPERSVRIRIAGGNAWLTIKGRSHGLARAEFEYPIPATHARELLAMCLPSIIDKTRHRIHYSGFLWEVDVFHGANEGLVLAEIEIPESSTEVPLPPWAGEEVSHDPRFFNANLATNLPLASGGHPPNLAGKHT
jgi:CYTH domain-containing protein